jgi:hypothetical protein
MNLKQLKAVHLFITASLLFINNKSSFAQKFVLPVFPDTQVEVNQKPEMFYSQVNWLKQSKDSLNFPMVLHVGDIVDYNNFEHWDKASEGFDILDRSGLPYALALGNHDTYAVGEHSGSAAPGDVNANLRITTKFNDYFPVSRFTHQRGRYEEGKSDNAYYTFRAGGLYWMVVSLEFEARQGPIDWANKVIAEHPSYNVIIITHFHLTTKGTINQTNAGYGNLTNQAIYDQLIKVQPNILMVLSGHVGTSAWRIDEGVKGNKIYQVLQDYQGQDAGGGYLRLLDIDSKAGTIGAKMYSPYYKITKTDSSQFSFNDVTFIAGKN